MLIARSEKNYSLFFVNLILLPPFLSNVINSLFKFTCKKLVASHKRIAVLTNQVSQVTVLSVYMFYSLVNTILADVFRRELVVICSCTSKWHCVVHVVNVLLCPLSEITDKPVQVMSLRHFNCAIFVVVYFSQIP